MNKKQLKNEELSSSFNTFRNFINKNFLYLFLISLLIFPVYKIDRLEENIINTTKYSKIDPSNITSGRSKKLFLIDEKKKYERIYYSMIVLIFLCCFFIYFRDRKRLFKQSKNEVLEEKKVAVRNSKTSVSNFATFMAWLFLFLPVILLIFSIYFTISTAKENDTFGDLFYTALGSFGISMVLIFLPFVGISNYFDERNKKKKKKEYQKKYRANKKKSKQKSITLKKDKNVQAKNDFNILSLKEFQNKYKSLKSYNSKTNKEVFEGKVLKAFIGSSYSTYGMISIIKNTEKLSDWDSIKKHVKDLAKNSNKDGLLMITSIESIGLLDFDFGQLDRPILLALAKYMTGVISEIDLDKKFVDFKVRNNI